MAVRIMSPILHYPSAGRENLYPSETGKHQFHIKCFGPKHIFLDGKELPFIYTSVEVYTDFVELTARKEYKFSLRQKIYQRSFKSFALLENTGYFSEGTNDRNQRIKQEKYIYPQSSMVRFLDRRNHCRRTNYYF